MPVLPQRTLLATLAVTALVAAGIGLSLGLRLGKAPDHDLARDGLQAMQPLLQLPAADDAGFAQALQQLQHSHSQHLLLSYRQADDTQRQQIVQALARANAQGWYSTADYALLQASLACLEEHAELPLPQCLSQRLQPSSDVGAVASSAP